ncbi:MAG: histidine kinase [Paenibacillus sp.]|nr:histidine kinase [Paenibacillus sp.]
MITTIPWDQYEVTRLYGANSGFEALDILFKHEVQILITDIRMPAMSGLELIEKVRAGWPHIDCILLTGFAEFQYAKRAIELQATNYLLKPVRDEELLPLISEIIRNQKTRRSEQAKLEWLEQTSEISVLEERRRIAHDLHDILGHTLTNTIIQLDIAKRLLETNKEGGLERLEQTQHLVRRGLEDVREAVSSIQSHDETLNLKTELERFLAEAEMQANVSITYSITLPFTIEDPLFIKVVMLALKEGITNGVRHGRASRFEFNLEFKEELLFVLWNDGDSYNGAEPGFGLTGMRERVRQLGGEQSLSADGNRGGTLLTLRIPKQ